MKNGKLIGHGIYEYQDWDSAIRAQATIKQRAPVFVAEFCGIGVSPTYHVATEEHIRRYHLGTIIFPERIKQ